ncbi:unnamed protein product, partial [Phaeothamnion confervicola]
DFGGPTDAWDALIACWIVSGYLAAGFAGLHHKEWIGAFDLLRYGLVLLFLKRSGYDETTYRRMLACIVTSTLIGLLWGYYGFRVTGERSTLGLHSVGHVNHSAIYLAIVFGAVLAWVRSTWATEGPAIRAAGLALCLALALSLLVMKSRAAVGAAFVVGILILGTYALRSGRRLWAVPVAALLIGGALLVAKPEVVEKNSKLLDSNNFLAYRDAVWRTGLEGWREFPVFGVGMGNYSYVNYERIEEWHRARGGRFDKERFRIQAHGHSLYLNTLVERGLAGFLALLAVLGAWGWALARNAPRTVDPPLRWTYWAGALAAWLVAILVGIVNTTLHHEHALVSMLLLGGWLSLRGAGPKAR